MSVIQIPGTLSAENNRSSEAVPAVSDDDDDVELTDDDDTSGTAPRKGRRRGNGGNIDMTAPDVHLNRAERLAAKLSKNGKNDEALRQLIRCTALCALVYGPEHWQYALSYANLAEGYIELRGAMFAAQGEQHAEMARSMFLTGLPQTNSESERAAVLRAVLKTYFILGRSQALLKKFTDAENSLQKCLSLLSQLSRVSCVETTELDDLAIKLNTCLARISAKLDKHAVSVSHYDTALDVAKRHFGAESLELIPLYQGLGQVEQATGHQASHERAIEHYLQAHGIAVANSKEGPSPEVAETARALAMAYSRTGDEVAEISAESYLNESLAASTQLYGPDHPSVCNLQSDLARLEIRTGRQEEGIKRLKSNLKAQRVVFGEFSEQVLESLKLIASLRLSEGNFEQALAHFNKCLQIEELLFGTNSRKTRETRKTLDTILAHPQMASKQSGAELKARPRFNATSKASTRTGVFN